MNTRPCDVQDSAWCCPAVQCSPVLRMRSSENMTSISRLHKNYTSSRSYIQPFAVSFCDSSVRFFHSQISHIHPAFLACLLSFAGVVGDKSLLTECGLLHWPVMGTPLEIIPPQPPPIEAPAVARPGSASRGGLARGLVQI